MRFPVAPLKHLALLPISNGVGEAAEFDDPDWPRYVRTTDIVGPRSLRDDTFRSLPPEVAKRAPLKSGDLLMTAAGGVGKSTLYVSDNPACYAGYLVRFRPRRDIDGRYVAYWAESQHFWDQVEVGKVVSTIDNFSAGKYQNLRCPSPSTATQRAIADYLDVETARIDALIAKKQRMIDLLDEAWFAFLRQAVASASSKTVRLRYISRIKRGQSPRPIDDPIYFDEIGSHGWVRIEDATRQGMYLRETRERLSEIGKAKSVVVGPGTLLVSIAASVGRAVITDMNCCYHDGWVGLLDLQAVPEFVYYCLSLPETFGGLGQVGTQMNINSDIVGRVEIPLLNQRAQQAFVGKVEAARHRVERSCAMLKRQIELLFERRQALITAAVNGELEVPGVAA